MNVSDRINQIDEAITTITLYGQEYSIDGRTYKRADLNTLYRQRKQYELMLINDSSNGYNGSEYMGNFSR